MTTILAAAEAARVLAQRLNDDTPERTAGRRLAAAAEVAGHEAAVRQVTSRCEYRPRKTTPAQGRAFSPGAVTRAASLLPGLARAGDRAAAARLLDPLDPVQVREVAFILAVAADRQPAGLVSVEQAAHNAYQAYRRRGIARSEMPGWVVTGQRRYEREARSRMASRASAA